MKEFFKKFKQELITLSNREPANGDLLEITMELQLDCIGWETTVVLPFYDHPDWISVLKDIALLKAKVLYSDSTVQIVGIQAAKYIHLVGRSYTNDF